jgi:hypothetical protein
LRHNRNWQKAKQRSRNQNNEYSFEFIHDLPQRNC